MNIILTYKIDRSQSVIADYNIIVPHIVFTCIPCRIRHVIFVYEGFSFLIKFEYLENREHKRN